MYIYIIFIYIYIYIYQFNSIQFSPISSITSIQFNSTKLRMLVESWRRAAERADVKDSFVTESHYAHRGSGSAEPLEQVVRPK